MLWCCYNIHLPNRHQKYCSVFQTNSKYHPTNTSHGGGEAVAVAAAADRIPETHLKYKGDLAAGTRTPSTI